MCTHAYIWGHLIVQAWVVTSCRLVYCINVARDPTSHIRGG